MPLSQLEIPVINPVRVLRKSKLDNGVPFMINSETLPQGQCYLEYPDGSVCLVAISYKDSDFILIRKLTARQGESLLRKYNLV